MSKLFYKTTLLISILFFFFIQQITFLVEAIYMLNLLNTQIDVRAFGMLSLLSPILLVFLKRHIKKITFILVFLLLICSFLSPLVNTSTRILTAGAGSAAFLLFFGWSLSYLRSAKINWGMAMAIGTLLSIALRALGTTLDISITGNTKFIGWILILFSIWLLLKNNLPSLEDKPVNNNVPLKTRLKLSLYIFGIINGIILIYFAFSSPGVISRWTGSNYQAINLILTFSILGFVLFMGNESKKKVFKEWQLYVWNILFLLILLLTIYLHTTPPPEMPNSKAIFVQNQTGAVHLITYLMLLLSPVIFLNISVFTHKILSEKPVSFAFPLTVSGFFFLILIFLLIFTNVWGYVGTISRIFRNKFYLPFLMAGLAMFSPYLLKIKKNIHLPFPKIFLTSSPILSWMSLALLSVTVLSMFITQSNPHSQSPGENKLILMTYNVQQGVDYFGNKNYQDKLQLIKKVNPDVLGLQESDMARISGGNSDLVRYLADKLNYYSYYGPKTVTGTFGTAILSRFPLHEKKTIFSYSDKDEIATTFAVIYIDSIKIVILNNHPAGGETARRAHLRVQQKILAEHEYVISLGDFNFNQSSPYYKELTILMNDSWSALYPNAIGPLEPSVMEKDFKFRERSSGKILSFDRIDMTDRIDFIFVTKNFQVTQSFFIPAPESGSDHPAHWAKVRWK